MQTTAVSTGEAPAVRTLEDELVAREDEAEQARIAAINKAKKAAISVFSPGGRGGGSGVVVTPDGGEPFLGPGQDEEGDR